MLGVSKKILPLKNKIFRVKKILGKIFLYILVLRGLHLPKTPEHCEKIWTEINRKICSISVIKIRTDAWCIIVLLLHIILDHCYSVVSVLQPTCIKLKPSTRRQFMPSFWDFSFQSVSRICEGPVTKIQVAVKYVWWCAQFILTK